MLDLTGKTALVTGGSRGIGQAVVYKLLEQGCEVIYTSRNNEIEDKRHNARHWYLDYQDVDSIDSCAQRIAALQTLDIFINNAGISIPQPVYDLTSDAISNTFQTNVLGPLSLLSSVARVMKAQKTGRIVHIASIAATCVKPGATAYSASKAAVASLARTMAVDLAPFKVLVNSVSPGPTQTQMVSELLSDEDIKQITNRIPLEKIAKPEEIARS